MNISEFYGIGWKRAIDYTALAKLRWVDKLSMEAIAAELAMRRSAVIRCLGVILENPKIIEDSKVRVLVHRTRKKFLGAPALLK